MSIVEPIQAIESTLSVAQSRPAQQAAASQPDFAAWLTGELSAVNTQIKAADHGVQMLAVGQGEDLHRVILDIERASLSIDLLVQVRNRVVEAYQEVLRLQV